MKKKNKYGGLTLIAVLFVCGRSAAMGAERTKDFDGVPVVWPKTNLTFFLSGAPRGVSLAQAQMAAAAAANRWNRISCSSIKIRIKRATLEQLRTQRSNLNIVAVHSVAWCADERGIGCHNSLNPAMTTLHFCSETRTSSKSRAVCGALLEINDVDYRWDDMTRPNAADLEVVLTHEFGHALGLDDSCTTEPGVRNCFTAPAEAQASVMWPLGLPNDVQRRRLYLNDEQILCQIYPNHR